MRHTVQMRLSDFDDEMNPIERCDSTAIPTGKIWKKTITEGEWVVCKFDDTVFFAQIINGRIHVYGHEAVCKWCGDPLAIRDKSVFCSGHCGRYQGKVSRDLNKYLHWDGATSFTLRHEIARIEGLVLEPRDLEPLVSTPPIPFYEEFEED